MIVHLLVAILLLTYAALQTDLARKCKEKKVVPDSQTSVLQAVNIAMLVASSIAVLYYGFHLVASDKQISMLSSYA